jgi:hypothetical protein
MRIAFFAVAKIPASERGDLFFAKKTCELLFQGMGATFLAHDWTSALRVVHVLHCSRLLLMSMSMLAKRLSGASQSPGKSSLTPVSSVLSSTTIVIYRLACCVGLPLSSP